MAMSTALLEAALARGRMSLWSGVTSTLTPRAGTSALAQSRTFASAPAPKKAEDAYVRPSSDKEVPRDIAGILDASAQTLFITELARGMSLALKYFFTKKVTVSRRPSFPDPSLVVFAD